TCAVGLVWNRMMTCGSPMHPRVMANIVDQVSKRGYPPTSNRGVLQRSLPSSGSPSGWGMGAPSGNTYSAPSETVCSPAGNPTSLPDTSVTVTGSSNEKRVSTVNSTEVFWGKCVPHSGCNASARVSGPACTTRDRKSTRLNSSHVSISYAVFCLKKKKKTDRIHDPNLDDNA